MLKNLLVFGGKGGVGKSSISCATAAYLAELLPDQNVLLISFDIAHNLADIFKVDIGSKMTQITPNLWAIEPDPDIFAERYTKKLAEKTRQLMKSMPLVGLIPDLEKFINETFQAKSIPLALKNAIFFQSILDADHPMVWMGEKEQASLESEFPSISFDIIVADMPPTGNMVALFEVPEDTMKHLLKYSLDIVSSVQEFLLKFQKLRKAINPLNWFRNGQITQEQRNLAKEILALLHEMEARGQRISDLMKGIGSLRLVTIAEKPSFDEIQRAWELSKPYIELDAVHINRIIPEELGSESNFLQKQISLQQKYTKMIENSFDQFQIYKSRYLEDEPIGIDGILELAREIYKDNPAENILNPSQRELKNPEFVEETQVSEDLKETDNEF
jgi:arsenite-transporting ATPase